ncbi:RNA-binding La domain protein [Macrophomina phaseolina]|uniref:RNA-binding La domain protein n=1 Tax=Macrophomina phaseolina TaxID=35725 RepID=A0ABQ8GCT8_9PEZI|nr:RNA-binding La domain protein [Macrophomina phaseolina]
MSDNQVHAEEAVPVTATPTSDQTVTKPAEQPAETATDANNEVIEAVESADSKKDESADAPKDTAEDKKDHRGPRKFQKFQKKSTYVGEESSDPVQIRKQIEFYFSDSNLPMDKYLMNQVGGYENKPIPLKVLHSFSRMRRFQPYSAVVDAIKESDFVELTEGEEVRRKVPLDEKFGNSYNDNHVRVIDDKTQPRSIYAKGFGEETEMTQFNIEKFFMQYGTINSVRLRRSYPDKKFKGSVFVEFEDEETQKNFLALDPKPKFEGKDLIIMGKKEYVDMKAKDIADGKIKAQPARPPHYSANGYRGRGGFRGGRRDRDDRDNRGSDGNWKEGRDKFQKGRGRGRGGRGGRGDRRGGDRNRERDSKDEKNDKEEKPAQRVDARGIPIVESSEPPKEAESKKRPAEDDAAGSDAKKAKPEEATA